MSLARRAAAVAGLRPYLFRRAPRRCSWTHDVSATIEPDVALKNATVWLHLTVAHQCARLIRGWSERPFLGPG